MKMTKNNWNEDMSLSKNEQEFTQLNGEDKRIWIVIQQALTQASIEQRRSRRWGIFFKTLTIIYVITITILIFDYSEIQSDGLGTGLHTAVVPIDGIIFAGKDSGAHEIQRNLKSAFLAKDSKGVILEINSPGGSPVQAEYIYRTVIALKAKYPDKSVHAVIGDIGASGAYYIAAAADTIHAAPASVVGSIGVLSGGFGFTGLIEKLGIERRLIIAGDSKAMLDPFLPENEADREHLQALLNQTHQQFIQRVLDGRGDRLSQSTDIFDGRIFSGETALELGLIDSLATPSEVAREWIGAEDRIYYQAREPILEKFSREFGFGMATGLGWIVRQGFISPISLSQ